MGISKSKIKAEVKKAFDDEKEKVTGQQDSIDRIADRLAGVIADQIEEGINTATVLHALASATGGAVSGSITLIANSDAGE